jgi:hypothetical protein
MPRADMLENFPLQIIAYDDLEKIVERALKDLSRRKALDKMSRRLRGPWKSLVAKITRALQDARLYGAPAADQWIADITDELERLRNKLGPIQMRNLQAHYMDLMDTLYGALLHHILRHIPTDVIAPQGHLGMYRMGMWRYATARNTAEKGVLRQVLEMMYNGGSQLDLEFDWKILGDK